MCETDLMVSKGRAEPVSGNSPIVSIVIPCYRGERFLRDAIESCLNQTISQIEIIVVDDASPDNCAVIADGYASRDNRVRVIRRPVNGGVSAAFNSGFNTAIAPYHARLAQDDVFAADAIEVMLSFLQSNLDFGLVYCDCIQMNADGRVLGTSRLPGPDEALLLGNRLGLCVMWRREVWHKLGGFDPEFDAAEDYDYWLRVASCFRIGKCEGPAPLFVRTHEEMGTLRFADRQERATLRLLRERFPATFPPLRRFLLRRKAIARVRYSAALDYRVQNRPVLATWRIIQSLLAWPLPFKRNEVYCRFARLKVLVTIWVRTLRRPTATAQ